MNNNILEEFYLETPTLKRKEEAIEMINEFFEVNSELHGDSSLGEFLKEETYEKWNEKIEFEKCEENMKNSSRVPAETYFLVRKSDNKLIGMIDLRLRLNDYLKHFGGHIGYCVRPSERRKGYNKINLYLALKRFQELGTKEIMIDCAAKNEGSKKTIESFPANLERSEIDPSDNTLTNVYWINVEEAINEYGKGSIR